MEINLRKLAWKEAATGGMILGVILIVVLTISYLFKTDLENRWIPGALNFLALAGMIFFYTKKMAQYHGDRGFSYGQSMGFILRMMLFAGLLAGFGQFILQNYVDPQYYIDLVENTLAEQGFSDDQIDQSLGMAGGILKNPIVMILSGALNMVIYGGVIGLVISAFVKRPINPFADEDNTQTTL